MIFVHDDDLGLTKKVNPCILVPPANSRNTFKTTISNWNLTEMQHHINLLSFGHWLIFDFLSKKYLRQVKNLKIIFINVISILKVHLGLPAQLWIFHNDFCPLFVFQEVDLFWTSWSWWASPIYAYPIFQSTWIYGFHDGGLGWGLWWSGRDLASVGWNGVRSGTSLAEVK